MAPTETSLIGQMAALARRSEKLGEEEELELVLAAKQPGNTKAMTRLVEAHLGMMIKMAKSLTYASQVEDLVNQGVIGFIEAVEGFDPERDRRLNVYAKYRVRAWMGELLMRDLNRGRSGMTRAHRKVFVHLRRDLRRDPDDRIMSDAEARRRAKELGVEPDDVHHVLNRYSGSDLSLDASADPGDGESQPLAETLADGSESIEDAVIRGDETEWRMAQLQRAIECLPDRERRILTARRLEEPPVALDVLATEFGISRQRVQQIDVSSFERMKRTVEEGMASRDALPGSREAREGGGEPAPEGRPRPARAPDMPRRATRG